MPIRPSRPALLLLLGPGLAALAQAHTGTDLGTHTHGVVDALAAGIDHPFTGPDHLAAMVAVGLWSALSQRAPWQAPLAFVVALLLGALLGLAGVALPAVEPVIATSVLVLGLLVATRRRLPWPAGLALAAGFAFFHGAAHGTELAGTHAAAALAGMVLATALLHGAGIALGRGLRGAGAWLPRLLGGGVAAFGLALLVMR
jgi:urease accessory protein